MSEASVLFPYVPARQTCKGDYRGRLTQRGRYRLGPLRLSTRFPFGLFRYSMHCGTSATLTVLPRLGRLTQSWNALRHESFAGNDRREHRPGIDGDFYGLRPWQRGDSRRWIHWRTSARAGGVMVRQFEQPHSRDAAIVLDLWQPAAPDATQSAENVELAVSFAATLAAELCRKGNSDVFLVAADPEPRVTGGPGSAALLQDLMERLALVDAQSRDRVPELLQRAVGQIEPGTEIVLVSTRPIDLSQADYAGKLPDDVRGDLAGHGLRMIDTSSAEPGPFFPAGMITDGTEEPAIGRHRRADRIGRDALCYGFAKPLAGDGTVDGGRRFAGGHRLSRRVRVPRNLASLLMWGVLAIFLPHFCCNPTGTAGCSRWPAFSSVCKWCSCSRRRTPACMDGSPS